MFDVVFKHFLDALHVVAYLQLSGFHIWTFQAQLNLGNRKWKDKLCMYEKNMGPPTIVDTVHLCILSPSHLGERVEWAYGSLYPERILKSL